MTLLADILAQDAKLAEEARARSKNPKTRAYAPASVLALASRLTAYREALEIARSRTPQVMPAQDHVPLS